MEKKEAYKWAVKQVRAQLKRHVDIVATLANIAAILKDRFPNFFWVGFYFLRGEHLILGPFQGPPACMKLDLDKGVCAVAATSKKSVVVPDVHQFPGHVACNSRSNSEIVVPVFDKDNNIKVVMDVDSKNFNDFDSTDQEGLETIATFLIDIFN